MLSYRRKAMRAGGERSRFVMLVFDPPAVLSLAALLTGLSALIWSLRRKP